MNDDEDFAGLNWWLAVVLVLLVVAAASTLAAIRANAQDLEPWPTGAVMVIQTSPPVPVYFTSIEACQAALPAVSRAAVCVADFAMVEPIGEGL